MENNNQDKDKRLNELETMGIARLLWRYSLPAVVGMLVMQLYNFVDRALIGHYGGIDGEASQEAIAGLTITFPVMNITTALGVLIGAGASARISILLGNGNIPGARKILGNSLTLTAILGLSYLTLFAWFMDDMLVLLAPLRPTCPMPKNLCHTFFQGCS